MKERHVFPRFFHDTLGESREVAVGHARRFILERFAAPLDRPDLGSAHRFGYTRDGPTGWPRRCRCCRRVVCSASYRANLRLGGLLSDGIALGHKTGFDSGSTLDYVYRNQVGGVGWIGRALDCTLSRCHRLARHCQRKIHVEELIRAALKRLVASGQPTRMLDIARAHGRYVLEALAAEADRPESILLRDFSPINVEAGQRLIADKGLAEIAHFVQADAFDRPHCSHPAATDARHRVGPLRAVSRQRDGVRSLAGLAAAIPAGGYLFHTGQPWHPQLEMIARALTCIARARPGSCAPADAGRDGPARRRRWFPPLSSGSTNGESSRSWLVRESDGHDGGRDG